MHNNNSKCTNLAYICESAVLHLHLSYAQQIQNGVAVTLDLD